MRGGVRKRIISILGILLSVVIWVSIVFAQTYQVVETAKLLTEPDVDARVISYLKPGTKVTEIHKSPSGKWIKVKTQDGVIGWVHISKVKPIKASSQSNSKDSQSKKENKYPLYRAIANVELKDSPNQEGKTIDFLKQGTALFVKGTEKGWAKVETEDGKEGWVPSFLLREVSKEELQQCSQIQGMSFMCGKPIKQEISKGEEVEPKALAKSQVKSLPGVGLGSPSAVSPSMSPKDIESFLQVKGLDSNKGVDAVEKEGFPSSFLSSKQEYKEVVSNIVYVKPNRTTMVEMSSLDINRVYCDGDITDVVFSEEKGVRVKIVKNNAFVKFVVKKIEDKEIPVENPVDLFFVCNDQVYSIIALPKRIPSAFIYLESKDKKIQEVMERTKDIPYEKRLLDIIKAIYVNKYEPNYQVVRMNKEFYLFKDIKVIQKAVIDIEGEGLRAKVFSLETNFDSNTQYVEIKEKDFVRKELTAIPLAISLDKTKLQGKDKATLIILEKRIVGE
jgi:conjugal transfer pilus assembly protein TraK